GRELSQLVGVMHQQFDLVDQLAVIHNVLAGNLGEWGFFRSLLSLIIPQQRKEAYEALDRLGIRDKANDKTAHLSGGEQQRVALARLLVQQPRAILADEPVASVDPARARSLLGTLVKIADEEGITLVVSLHSVDLALEFFPRIIGLRDGSVQLDRPSMKIDDPDLQSLYELEDDPTDEKFAAQ
ncbi:MAG: phosphonate ABC transporter ATP-binding protein, partial [bacterium]